MSLLIIEFPNCRCSIYRGYLYYPFIHVLFINYSTKDTQRIRESNRYTFGHDDHGGHGG